MLINSPVWEEGEIRISLILELCEKRTYRLKSDSFLLPLLVVKTQFSSVQFSRSVVSDSLQPRGLQHARPPCPSPTPGLKVCERDRQTLK